MTQRIDQLPNPEPPAEGDPGKEQQIISNRIIGPDEAKLRNFTDDESVMSRVKKLIPTIKTTRAARGEVEGRWDRYRDIYALRKNISYYAGRSQLFLPLLRKAVDTTVRVAKDALFSGDYIDAIADDEKLKKIAVDFVRFLLEDQAKIKVVSSLFLRQLYIIGTSAFKLGWMKRQRIVKYRELDGGEMVMKSRKIFDRYGPSIDVVDMKRLYVWPETAIDYETLKLIFEDTTSTVGKLMAKKKYFDPDALLKVVERKSAALEKRRVENSERVKEGLGDTALDEEEVDITEAWALIELPIGEGGKPVETWAMITLADEDVLRVQENPWWFQHPPYLLGAIFRTHDYFYGHGLMEAGEMWQYMANDIANQSMDCGTFSINGIVAYNPEEIDDPDAIKIQPCAKWPIKPDEVEFMRPPAQLAMEGMQMVRFLINVVQEMTGATALVSGAPREGLGRATATATGVTALTQQATGDIMDHVEELESQVYTPMLKAVEIMAHEMMDDPMVVRMMGPDGMKLSQQVISPQDLVLSADLSWVSSSRVRERTIQAQQLINYLNVLSGIDPQLLAASGVRVKFGKIIQTVARVGLDLKEAEDFVEDVTQTMPDTHPALEHQLLAAGRTVVASPLTPPEHHKMHIEAHFAEMQLTQNEMYRSKLQEHIASHFAAIQAAAVASQPQGGGSATPMNQGNGMADMMRGIMSQTGGASGMPGGGSEGMMY